MSRTEDRASLLILQQLQRVLKKIVTDQPQFEKMETDCKKHLFSLTNLLSQRESVLAVGQKGLTSLTTDFPDLQARLLVKISSEVDSKVDTFRIHILLLKVHHEAVSRARTEIVRLLRKHSKEMALEAVLYQGTAKIPPLQVMLDWVNDLEVELRELYYSRLHYLESIMEDDTITSSTLATLWIQNPQFLNIIQDCKEQTCFFLEEAR